MLKITKTELDARIVKAIENHQAFPFLETHCPYALAKLDELIKQGQDTHGPMDWKDLGIAGNISHADKHSDSMFDNGKNAVEGAEDHLLNACCRLIMALELREEAKDTKK